MRASEIITEHAQQLEENLRDWFKDKWVRFGPDGKIRGDCARGSESEGKPKCLPQSKAQALGKKGRASAAARKRRQDPNPDRRGAAINVATKKKTNEELDIEEDRENFNGINLLLQKDDEEVFVKASAGSRELGHVLFVMDGDYLMPQDLEVEERYRGQGIAQTMYDFVKSKGYKIRRSGQQTDAGAGFWAKHRPEQNVWEEQHSESCPHCGGPLMEYDDLMEKKDACYYKVKASAKVWPSAYASGRLVQCRKKGAGNYGNKSESAMTESNTLSPGAIRKIQQVLNKKYNANLDVDGVLGDLTRRSIEKYMPRVSRQQAPDPNRNTRVQGFDVKDQGKKVK